MAELTVERCQAALEVVTPQADPSRVASKTMERGLGVIAVEGVINLF